MNFLIKYLKTTFHDRVIFCVSKLVDVQPASKNTIIIKNVTMKRDVIMKYCIMKYKNRHYWKYYAQKDVNMKIGKSVIMIKIIMMENILT